MTSQGHWIMAVLICVVAATWAGHRYKVEQVPTSEFIEVFGGEGKEFFGAILGTGSQGGVWRVRGTYIDVPGNPSTVVIVLYDATPEPGQPKLQIRLGSLAKTPGGRIVPTDGSPIILCDFDDEQAAYVLEHGLPRSLIDALVDAASNSGWTPTRWGGGPPVVVRAEPYLSPRRSGS